MARAASFAAMVPATRAATSSSAPSPRRLAHVARDRARAPRATLMRRTGGKSVASGSRAIAQALLDATSLRPGQRDGLALRQVLGHGQRGLAGLADRLDDARGAEGDVAGREDARMAGAAVGVD